jgi:hypothetical protein
VLTELTPKDFPELPAVCAVSECLRAGGPTQSGRVRQRQAGGGRRGQWRSAEPKRVCIVVEPNADPLQTLVGEVVEVSPARVNY